jgi:hypothetical protein
MASSAHPTHTGRPIAPSIWRMPSGAIDAAQLLCFTGARVPGTLRQSRLRMRCWFAERNTGRCESRFALPGHRPREISAVAQGPWSLEQAAEKDAIRSPHGNLRREAPPAAKVGCARCKSASKRLPELDAHHEKVVADRRIQGPAIGATGRPGPHCQAAPEYSIAQQLKKPRLKEPAGPLPGIHRAQEGSNRTPSAQLRAMTPSGDEKWPAAGAGCPRREDS